MSYKLDKPCSTLARMEFLSEYNDKRCMETAETEEALYALEDNEIMKDGVPVVDEDYVQKQIELRKRNFESAFIETSFVKDGVVGWYRQIPNGYSNAPQSIDIVNNIVHAQGGLTEDVAELMIFYKQPNYRYKNQCTEEWLIAHAFNPGVMSVEQWDLFYLDFQKRWALLKYKQLIGEQ